MALWQYRLRVVPKHKMNRLIFDEVGFIEEELMWGEKPTDVSVFHGFERYLDRSKAWSDCILLFGSLDSNCLSIFAESTLVEAASFRVDLRNQFNWFLEAIIEFLDSDKFVLLDESFEVLDLELGAIKKKIGVSRQFRIYNKPKGDYENVVKKS